jgi:hypothetical protein
VRIEWAIDRSADRTGRLEGLRLLLAEREETIRDLLARLDCEAKEGRVLTAILTGPRRPWWRRWFR